MGVKLSKLDKALYNLSLEQHRNKGLREELNEANETIENLRSQIEYYVGVINAIHDLVI